MRFTSEDNLQFVWYYIPMTKLLEQAIEQALSYGCVHLDGVIHCLHQLTEPKEPPKSLDLSDRPDLQHIGNQPIDISRYEKLLKYSW